MSTSEAPERRYRIAEVSRLTGFTPTTLRYYEDAGVLTAPDRTAAGYRTYDDRAIERLRFVARAKELGCTLEEIAGLVEAWDADECGPVKHRLRSLVNAKVSDIERHIAEQATFAAQLRATAANLAGRPVDGPCDETCGCTSTDAAAAVEGGSCGPDCGCGTTATAGSATRVGAVGAATPIACSLSGGDMQTRIAEWQALLATVEQRAKIPNGLRFQFAHPAPLGEIARLAGAEQQCCPFLSFDITVDPRGVTLEITAQTDRQAMLSSVLEATK